MRPAIKAKLTKRQRKAARGPNHAVKQSLKRGEQFSIGGIVYRGTNPAYKANIVVGAPVQYIKVSRGIPFVRA